MKITIRKAMAVTMRIGLNCSDLRFISDPQLLSDNNKRDLRQEFSDSYEYMVF